MIYILHYMIYIHFPWLSSSSPHRHIDLGRGAGGNGPCLGQFVQTCWCPTMHGQSSPGWDPCDLAASSHPIFGGFWWTIQLWILWILWMDIMNMNIMNGNLYEYLDVFCIGIGSLRLLTGISPWFSWKKCIWGRSMRSHATLNQTWVK